MNYTTCSENVCVPKALHVEREILRKKSLLPFLQIRLIYAVNGPNKLNKSTNQRRRRRARRRSGRSHSATAEGEGEALRRLEGGPPAPIDLSITRTLSLFLAMPRHHSVALALSRYPSVPLALSHYYSIPHALFGPSRSLSPLLGSLHSCSHSLAITRSLSLPPAPTHYFWPSHGPSHSIPLFLAISGHRTAPLNPSHSF